MYVCMYERLAQLVGSLVSISEVRGSSLALSTTKNLSHTVCIGLWLKFLPTKIFNPFVFYCYFFQLTKFLTDLKLSRLIFRPTIFLPIRYIVYFEKEHLKAQLTICKNLWRIFSQYYVLEFAYEINVIRIHKRLRYLIG